MILFGNSVGIVCVHSWNCCLPMLDLLFSVHMFFLLDNLSRVLARILAVWKNNACGMHSNPPQTSTSNLLGHNHTYIYIYIWIYRSLMFIIRY